MRQYTAYIDEAGDEGFGKLAAGPSGGQSRWLILGACIVSRENDLKMPAWRDKILSRFPAKKARDLHFRDLKHDQKVVVCQELAKLPIGAVLTMSHKVTIPGSEFEHALSKKRYLYNYLLRWLLERITLKCKQVAAPGQASLRLVFSRRGGTDYASMRSYLKLIRDGRELIKKPVRSIQWTVLDLDMIFVENHNKWAGLQLSDCITSAFFNAVEPNVYGNYEPSYANLLKGNLLTTKGVALNCGITPVPSMSRSALDDEQSLFFDGFR